MVILLIVGSWSMATLYDLDKVCIPPRNHHFPRKTNQLKRRKKHLHPRLKDSLMAATRRLLQRVSTAFSTVGALRSYGGLLQSNTKSASSFQWLMELESEFAPTSKVSLSLFLFFFFTQSFFLRFSPLFFGFLDFARCI